MNCKPKQRKFYRPKPKQSRTLWRSGRVILKGDGMRKLRAKAFRRSLGYCEAPDCLARIFEDTFELHHVRHRSLGGSDEIDNVRALCSPCHRKEHSQ